MTRTEGDTWDLASSVGATATAVAASRAMASQGPDALLDDPLAEPLVRAVGIDTFVKLVDGELVVDDDPLLNRRAMNEQMAVRTRFFDDFFTAATASGIRQAVILASGLDTRAYRLPWPAGTVVYEIDQPEVIEFKTRTLADLGAEPTAQRRTVVDRSARRLAFGAEGGRVRHRPADGVERRRTAGVPAAGGAGSAVRQHHRAVGAGQPGGDRAHGHERVADGLGGEAHRAVAAHRLQHQPGRAVLHRRAQQRGRLPDQPTGGRSTSAGPSDAYAANGFELPDDELAAFGGDSGYLSATAN